MFDYGQKKFVNLEAEDDIADKYEKKYPDYVHEPALELKLIKDIPHPKLHSKTTDTIQ